MFPSYFLLLAGMAQAHPENLHRIAMIGAAFLLFVCLGIPLSYRAARRYQQQLEAIRNEQS